MKIYFVFTIFITVLIFGCTSAQLQTDSNEINSAKYEDLEKLTELMAGRETMEQMLHQLFNQLTQYILKKIQKLKRI